MSQSFDGRARSTLAASLVLLSCLVNTASAQSPALAAIPATDHSPERVHLGMSGISFVENHGQWTDRDIRYKFQSAGLEIACRDSALTMASPSDRRGDSSVMTVSFPGSDRVEPVGAKQQTAVSHYFIGDDQSTWARNVPSFDEVVYETLYDGIDLHLTRGGNGVLKYEFHVAPGADPSVIQIAYAGIDSLCVDGVGNLHIDSPLGTLVDSAPVVWQTIGDQRTEIPAHFGLIDDTTCQFVLDRPIDPDCELIIDPDVQWMVYLGDVREERAYGVTVDPFDNALVVGSMLGNAFLARIDPQGTLLSMTILGGGAVDWANGVAADDLGNAYVVGRTESADFSYRNNAFQPLADAFLVKVDATGLPQWMTYLGGSNFDYANGVAVDEQGSAWVTGSTSSSDFSDRLNNYFGHGDGFIAKVNTDGSHQWMRYLGGSGDEEGTDVEIDSACNGVMTGFTYSNDFEGRINTLHAEGIDSFAIKIDPSGEMLWMTYLGGSERDEAYGIAIDSHDNALITGYTRSSDFEGRLTRQFPPNSRSAQDIFALKVSPAGTVAWMAYVGSRWVYDEGRGIAADDDGNVFVTGQTYSTDMAGRTNSTFGYDDACLIKLNGDGQLMWSHYLGGSLSDFGTGIAIDSAGDALVAGYTASPDFEGAINAPLGGFDAFLVKVHTSDAPRLLVNGTCPEGGPIHIRWFGATPDGSCALLRGSRSGRFSIPPGTRCAGTRLGVADNVQFLGLRMSGPNGSASFRSVAGPALCGEYLQLLDLDTCTVSNVIRVR